MLEFTERLLPSPSYSLMTLMGAIQEPFPILGSLAHHSGSPERRWLEISPVTWSLWLSVEMSTQESGLLVLVAVASHYPGLRKLRNSEDTACQALSAEQ